MIWLACARPEEPVVPIGVVSADCITRDNNDSRVDCEVALGEHGSVTVEVTDAIDGTVTAFRAEEPAEEHSLLLAPLVAERSFSFVASSSEGGATVAGEFETGALPDDIAWEPVITGTPAGFQGLLTAFSCTFPGRVALVDPFGRAVWYDQITRAVGSLAAIQGLTWTPEQTALLVADRAHALEIGLGGNLPLHWTLGEEFADPVHHDLTRDGEETILLTARAVADDDGRVVIDDVLLTLSGDGSEQSTWAVSDHVDPTGFVPETLQYWLADFGGAADVFHTNAITVEDDGDWLVSLRNMSSVLGVAGPSAPDAGAVRWSLRGDPDAPVPRPLEWTSSAGLGPLDLQGQHQPIRTRAGTLAMLDNRFDGPSRVVEVAIDEDAGTADLIGVWDLGLECPFQGGVTELEDGSLAATCVSKATIVGLDRGGGEAWRMLLDCGLPSFVSMVRAVAAEGLPVARPLN